MADSGRTVFGSVGGGSEGLAFDGAAGTARIELAAPGKITLGADAWDYADWDDYAGVNVTIDTQTFGAFDVDNDDATFYFTEAGLYLYVASVTFEGSGSRAQRFARIVTAGGSGPATAFTPCESAALIAVGPDVFQSEARIAAVLPGTIGASARVEFFSDGASDEVTAVNFEIRRLLAGAWT